MGEPDPPRDHVVEIRGVEDVELAEVGNMLQGYPKSDREVDHSCDGDHIVTQTIWRILITYIHLEASHVHTVDGVPEHDVNSRPCVYQHLLYQVSQVLQSDNNGLVVKGIKAMKIFTPKANGLLWVGLDHHHVLKLIWALGW